ncbi:MAG: formyltransferase family protein [Erythrobacter sp.]|nr:formyltransferase family protein [Erythrobacter sp.]
MSETPITVVLMGTLSAAVRCFDFCLASPQIDLIGVVCRDDDPRQSGETYVIDKARTHGITRFSLDEMPATDIGLAIRFDQLLTSAHRARFAHGVLNLHGAPLPDMRGSLCEVAAILERRIEFGVSLHVMEDGVDTGPLLCVERFAIPTGATAGELLREANRRGVELVETYLVPFVRGDIDPTPQDLSRGRSYRRSEVLEQAARLDGFAPFARSRKVRALHYGRERLPRRHAILAKIEEWIAPRSSPCNLETSS